MNVWGIHMGEKVGSSPLDKNYVAIGWGKLGNLYPPLSKERLKKHYQRHTQIKRKEQFLKMQAYYFVLLMK